MNSTYTIRRAAESDVQAMIDLRAEAEAWMAAAGITQWLPEYAAYGRQTLREVVKQGVAWIVEASGEVAATVSLSGAEISDRDFWARVHVDPEDARYLGKMIVSRHHSGLCLGDAILNWACDTTADAGLPWLRLDARRDNRSLQRYYLTRGFDHVATLEPLPGQKTESGWLGQRDSKLVLPAPLKLVQIDG